MFAQNPGTGFTIWLTGMQGAGKRTLARELVNRLRRLEKPVDLLEGADWDVFLGKGPGSTKEERNAIIRRNGFVARAITRAGGFAVIAQISPYRETREAMRREIGRFLEVFVDCPDIQMLMSRDSTGQYMKAMRGEIPNFIGITDPYEPPASPEVRYDSSKQTVDEGAALVLEALVREGVLTPDDVGLARMPPKKEKRSRKPPESIQFTPGSLVLPKQAPVKADASAAKSAAPKPSTVPGKFAAAPAKVDAKKVEAKKPEAGKPEAKKVEAKKVEAKKVEAKKVEAKKVEAKKVEAKKVEAKKVEAKKVEAKKVEAKKVEAKKVEAKKVEAKKVEAKKPVTKKPEAKKPVAKKPEAKKPKAKKPVAKKPVAKKSAAKTKKPVAKKSAPKTKKPGPQKAATKKAGPKGKVVSIKSGSRAPPKAPKSVKAAPKKIAAKTVRAAKGKKPAKPAKKVVKAKKPAKAPKKVAKAQKKVAKAQKKVRK